MPDNKIMDIQSMLEQMETVQLDEMLCSELQKEHPDAYAVQLILAVLQEREKDFSVEMDPGTEQAWQEYIGKTSGKAKGPVRSVLLKVASFAVILAVLFLAMPQQVEAESIWERLIRWTDSVFELFSPDDRSAEPAEYVFQTDNPGLQQVYDAVVELGVTDPVVPMWLPEGYELVECKVTGARSKSGVYSLFLNGDSKIILKIDKYQVSSPNEYQKDDTSIETLEISNVCHNVIRNNGKIIAIWTKGNLECSISVDCDNEALQEILTSIYNLEGYK